MVSLGLATAATAPAQIPLYTISGATDGDASAFVAGVGDVDGDAVPDFAVGAPLAGNGSVTIYSGATFEELSTLTGESAGDGFGFAIAAAGNVTGSGLPTLLVGAPLHDGAAGADAGRAYLYEYQAPSWVQLHAIDGQGAGDELGHSVAGAGDVDGDARDDVIVGAPLYGAGDRGRAYVLGDSQSTGWGAIGTALSGPAAGGEFGAAVSGAGLVDGDGLADVVVGAPGGAGAAYVHALSSGSWTQVWVLQDDPLDLFGTSVRAADLDGDGRPDLIVGSPEDDTGGPDAGSVIAFSGATGNKLYEATGSASLGFYFGYSIDVVPDLNGDGRPDLLVGIPEATQTGAARLLDGTSGQTLYTLYGDVDDGLGESVASIGDVTGDGHPEILVGAPQTPDPPALPGPGYARLYTGWGAPGASYCGPANLNSSGLPGEIYALGSALVASNDLTLIAVQLPTKQFGYFLNSMSTGSSNPPGSQGKLCLSGGIGRYKKFVESTGVAGVLTLPLDLTQTPTPSGPVAIQPGQTWYFQGWFRDKNPGATSNFTDGVQVTFL